MGYVLEYWEKDGPQPESYAELRSHPITTVKDIDQLVHCRPSKTSLITLRHTSKNRKEKEYIIFENNKQLLTPELRISKHFLVPIKSKLKGRI